METLTRIRLVVRGSVPSAEEIAPLRAELPSLRVEVSSACGVCDPIVDCAVWATSPSFADLERAVRESSSDAISVRGREVVRTALEVATRFQRLVGRRNGASRMPLFDAALRARGHDEGARDVWQWTLRLDPNASLVAQLAALFVDRDDDVDAPLRARAALDAAGVDERTIHRVTMLLEHDAELVDRRAARIVEDAAALSFLARGSDALADAEGRAAARFAVDATLRTMSRAARQKLATVRLRPDILHFLFESVAA